LPEIVQGNGQPGGNYLRFVPINDLVLIDFERFNSGDVKWPIADAVRVDKSADNVLLLFAGSDEVIPSWIVDR
jgi:hypothetical protein